MQQLNQKWERYNHKAGDKFGRLTLTGKTYFRNDKDGTKTRMVECVCECGKIRDYILYLLKNGQTKSCGCFKSDLFKESPNSKTHGLRKHPLYRVWDGMKQRCYNHNAINYPDYGGRGITIIPLWKDSFKKFYDWAISHGWRKGLEIDRRDNDGNYEPDNCWFRTSPQQRRNTRVNHWITAFGETKCLKDWTLDARCKVTASGLKNRVFRDKADWPDIELAITTPPTTRKQNKDNRVDTRMIFAFGEEKSLAEWLKDERCVADERTIRLRLRKGWDAEKSITTFQRKKPTKKK